MHTPDHNVTRFADPERADSVFAYAQRLINSRIVGRIELHYDTRSLTLINVTGDTAMRLTQLIAEHDPGDPTSARWAENCDPETASGEDRWINIDLDRVLASDWHPERLVVTDADRSVFAAAFRLLDANPDPADFDQWDDSLTDDYVTLFAHKRRNARRDHAPAEAARTHVDIAASVDVDDQFSAGEDDNDTAPDGGENA